MALIWMPSGKAPDLDAPGAADGPEHPGRRQEAVEVFEEAGEELGGLAAGEAVPLQEEIE